MSTVTRNGVSGIRPRWNYTGNDNSRGLMLDQLEMIESVRNVCEQIRDSQMMQCDVAAAIKTASTELVALNREIRGLRRDLKKRKL